MYDNTILLTAIILLSNSISLLTTSCQKTRLYDNIILLLSDINECSPEFDVCSGASSECVNIIGSFNCTCDPGHLKVEHQDGSYTCEPINECEDETHQCAEPAQCKDRSWGFICDCPDGYEKLNATHCGGKRHTKLPFLIHVVRVKQTQGTTFSIVVVVIVSLSVILIIIGLTLNFSDINECITGLDQCCKTPPAECDNTIGSYNCTCPPGYTGDGFTCTGNLVF